MVRFIHASSLYGNKTFLNMFNAITILLIAETLIKFGLSELLFQEIDAVPERLELPLYFFIASLLLVGLTEYNIRLMRKDDKVTTIRLLPQRTVVKVSLFSFFHVALPVLAMIFAIQFVRPTILTADGLYVLGVVVLGVFFTLRALSKPTQSTKQQVTHWFINSGLVFIVSVAFYLNAGLVIVSLALITVGVYHYAKAAFSGERRTYQRAKNNHEPAWLIQLIKKRYLKVNLLIHYDRQFFLHPFREVAVFTGQLIVIIGLIIVFMFQDMMTANFSTIDPQIITWWTTVFAVFFVILNLSQIKTTDVTLLPFKPFERWSLISGYRHLKIVLLSTAAVATVLTVIHVGFRLFYLFNSHQMYDVNVTYIDFLMTGFESYFVAFIYVLGFYHVTLILHHLFLLLTRDAKLYLREGFNKKSQLSFLYIIVFPFLLYDYISNIRFITNTVDLKYVGLVIILSLLIDYYANRKLEVVT
ncbi:hypothetical protein [Halolactibacillus sp. JCM 19043]|uniref:hypothetical protein n=1 Tax=Halolactibacillus sp. JCM 19043 TaxID=1460638 RepID=UPI00078146E2|nr:hypothetical protein [Halolactibacillus sp. JCM 19043]